MPIEVIAEAVAGAVAEGAVVVAEITTNIVAEAAVEVGLRTVEAVADVAANTVSSKEENQANASSAPESPSLKLLIGGFLGLAVVCAIIFGAILFAIR